MSRDYVLHPFGGPANLQIDYARELNEQQYAAVTAPPGPSLVIAGAGSGKTRTLTYRVAYLIEQGVPAERILLLTFTNKAAHEMMRRVTDLLGQELRDLWGGTFHAVGSRILRQHARAIGYQQHFSILDREDAKHMISSCISDAGIDVKATGFPKAEVLAEMFSLAANTREDLSRVLAAQYGDFQDLEPGISDMQRRYAERKQHANTMDFDDLLVLWLRLMEQSPEVRDFFQRKFQFVLVDEYQDTNKLQSDLIDLMAAKHHNIMAVGDDAQSIYAWRGANYKNILQFPVRYPEAKIYKIEVNYRSTPEILTVANAAIAANTHQFAKELASARKSGMKPAVVSCADASQQAAFIAQRVLELREEGVNPTQMAVLYRSHFHALELQLELTKHNIPFSITSGIRVFEQAHMKDVSAYLKLITNPQDELSFKRLAQLLPGIAAKGSARLWELYQTHLAAAGQGSLASPTLPRVARALQACAVSVPRKAQTEWAQFTTTVAQMETGPAAAEPGKAIKLVLEACYEDYLKRTYENSRSRLEDLEQLAIFAQQFSSTQEFLTQLALLSNIEAEDDRAGSETEERLRLSTIHQAKGLEFDVVFIIMLCEGLFPSQRSVEDLDRLEEERRLFYVAVTRARNELYLAHPSYRAGFGDSGGSLQLPSRFLGELPEDLTEKWNLHGFA